MNVKTQVFTNKLKSIQLVRQSPYITHVLYCVLSQNRTHRQKMYPCRAAEIQKKECKDEHTNTIQTSVPEYESGDTDFVLHPHRAGTHALIVIERQRNQEWCAGPAPRGFPTAGTAPCTSSASNSRARCASAAGPQARSTRSPSATASAPRSASRARLLAERRLAAAATQSFSGPFRRRPLRPASATRPP